MTSLKKIFEQYYAPNKFLQFNKNIALYHYIKGLAVNSQSVNIIFEGIKSKGAIHPDDFIAYLHKIGFKTWEDLLAFITAVDKTSFNYNPIKDILFPKPPDIQYNCKVSSSRLWQDIRQTGFKVPPLKIDIGDDPYYYLVPDNKVMELIRACPSNKFQYIADSRDCDDFARILEGWFSEQNLGNVAIGTLHTGLKFHDGSVEDHAMCWLMTEQNKLWMIEPQNDDYCWEWGKAINWPHVIDLIPSRMSI